MSPRIRTLAALAALALAPMACGGGDGGEGSTRAQTTERPVPPPPGWRTIRNSGIGATIAAPKRWPAQTRRTATLVRSDDQLVSITVAVDRTAAGRRLSPARYARRTMRSLPGFEGTIRRQVGRVRGSPYPNAVVEGSGTVSSTIRPQRISVAVFRRPGRATYAAVVFRNARVQPRFNDRTIVRVLRTLRASG